MMNISAKRLQEINNIPDESIDTSDIPELDDHFWENAKLIRPIIITMPNTTDLLDTHETLYNEGKLRIVAPIFRDYGGQIKFSGPIATLKVFEDNTLVREMLSEPGNGRILVVDGGGSLRCALLGDKLGELAVEKGWNGLVIYGAVRDAATLAKLSLGIKAINTYPLKSVKRGLGDKNIPLRFAEVTFNPGEWLYADLDGIIVSSIELV